METNMYRIHKTCLTSLQAVMEVGALDYWL